MMNRSFGAARGARVVAAQNEIAAVLTDMDRTLLVGAVPPGTDAAQVVATVRAASPENHTLHAKLERLSADAILEIALWIDEYAA